MVKEYENDHIQIEEIEGDSRCQGAEEKGVRRRMI